MQMRQAMIGYNRSHLMSQSKETKERAYLCMVALPSEENTLRSEVIVAFESITKGFNVVPSRY